MGGKIYILGGEKVLEGELVLERGHLVHDPLRIECSPTREVYDCAGFGSRVVEVGMIRMYGGAQIRVCVWHYR